MIALAAFLLGAAEPADPTPDRLMLDAFRAACNRVDDLEAMRADALQGGWTPIEDAADARIARINRMGRESAGEVERIEIASFRSQRADRELFLIVSHFRDADGLWGNGCRLYDFGARAPIDPDLLTRWMTRPPTGTDALPGLGSQRLWEPGWRMGMTVNAMHVPEDSRYRTQVGFSGNVLVAQAIGGF